jgi:outer membrane protein assembly factor BamB
MSAIRAALVTSVSAVVLAGALVTPATAATTAWTQPGYGPARNYYNPAESVLNASTIDDLDLSWSKPLPEAAGGSCSRPSEPLAAGGRVFDTDQKGIGAYMASNGRLLWRHDFRFPEDESTARMAVVGGLLVAGTTGCQSQSDPDGTIVALRVVNGSKAWEIDARGPVGSLVADRGLVMVSGSSESSPAAVRAFRVSDGKLRWRAAAHQTTGVVAGGKLLVRRTDVSGVAALAVDTGKRVWGRTGAWDGIAATPAGDRFLLRDSRSTLISVNAATGAVQWKATGAGGKLATDGRRIYAGMSDVLTALDVRNGRKLWSKEIDGWDVGQPVRAGGLVYSMIDRDKLRVWNAATGAFVHNGGEPGSHGDIAVSGGRLFLVDEEGVMAFTPQ